MTQAAALALPIRTQGQLGRERILPVLMEIRDHLAAIVERLAAIERRLEKLESRPAHIEVREWKPDHRRLKDGGTQVRQQRRAMRGVTE